MSHLTDQELIDAIEDSAQQPFSVDRRRHLDACDACRRRADDLRAVIARAGEATVPEPSPLFWDHFAARVREGIDGAPPGEPVRARGLAGWFQQASVRWAAFATLVVALMVTGVWRVTAPTRRVSPATVGGDARRAPAVVDPLDRSDAAADPAWAVVQTVADGVNWDDAVAGIGAEPGAAERAARALTPDERSELVKLLLAETKRPGA